MPLWRFESVGLRQWRQRTPSWLLPWRTLIILMMAVAAGCASRHHLMPTPTIYTHAGWDPFADVPAELRIDEARLLYVTDRAPEDRSDGSTAYGQERSRSMAFGEAVVRIGDDLSWPELVELSRDRSRDRNPALTLESVSETARFGKTPPTLVISDERFARGASSVADPATAEAEARFRGEMAARLALSPRKTVLVWVHGFANSFEDAAVTTAELWHFLGREGVPVCYTWPAGKGGVRAYEYTLASTQFTIYHFKRTLRLIASCPEVERVNIIAHSRGTEVVTDAIRELYLELRSTTDAQRALKLGTVVLAAADMDLDVVIARNATERIGRAVERSALYISEADQALGFSGWLFGGRRRLGDLDPKIFDGAELETLRRSQHLQIIDARVKRRGAFGHGYFHANPAVSSDLILLVRYGLAPGAEHGRPLDISKTGLWMVTDAYPGSEWIPPAASPGGAGSPVGAAQHTQPER